MQVLRTHRGRWATLGTSALALLLLMFATTAPASAQSSSATVRGTVQDSSGAVLPGATVTLTNSGTKAVQSGVTDNRGQYTFASLFPGSYELRVELSGFKTYE